MKARTNGGMGGFPEPESKEELARPDPREKRASEGLGHAGGAKTDLMPPMLSAHVIVIAARVGMYLRNKLVVKHRFSPGQLRSEKSPFA
jgi:hypothetical protein